MTQWEIQIKVLKHIDPGYKVRTYSKMSSITLEKYAQNRSYPGFEKEKEGTWNGPFVFIQGADTQLGMISTYLEKQQFCTWDEEIDLTTRSIEAINKMVPRPRFFVVCGDLVDAMPGTEYRRAQEDDYIKVFAKLHPDIPLVCVCGNHDIGNTPTPASVKNYCNRFGDDYFSFFCGGVMFLVLNSQYFEDPSLVQDFAKSQEVWLDEKLLEAKTGNFKHVVIFQHIPWFLREPGEEKEYFNISCDLREKMLQKFKDAGIKAIFCGHYHRNAGGFYKDMELVVTSAVGAQLGIDKSGFRVVKVLDDRITHAYYAIEDAPETISLDS